MEILACDVGNAYLYAPYREKVWFQGRLKTGPDCGKILVVTRALYGLKSSRASWRAILGDAIKNLGFESSVADSDFYRQLRTRETGAECYK